MGVYGPQARKFVNFVGTKLSEKYNDPRRKAFLKQSIGIAIQQGNAKKCCFLFIDIYSECCRLPLFS